MAKEPAFVLAYGKSGIGKTTDAGYSFPQGLFIAARGALKSVTSTCGYTPAQAPASTIMEVTEVIKQAGSSGQYDAIIVDDFSFLAEQTFVALEQRFTGYKLFGALRQAILTFRASARFAGAHVILNCWEKGPKTLDSGDRIRGGPDLTGKLPEQLPAMCDLVLRADLDPQRKGWPGVYRVNGGQDYVGKDRDDGTPSPAPMNLGEILRHNGYAVSRLPALEWQEPVVEQIASSLTQSDPKNDVNTLEQVYAHLLTEHDPRHARWTVRDGWHRAQLRRAMVDRHVSFFARKSGILGL